MRGDNDAKFLRQLERSIQLRVVHAERAFVGEEHFEGADAALHDFAELLLGLVVELCHAHVEREIARGLADSLFHPKLKTLQRVVLARRTAHLDKGGRTADQCGLAAGNVIILRHRPHERQVNVNMRINETGEDKFPLRVNHLRVTRWLDVRTNGADGFANAENVGHVALAGCHDFAILDEERHAPLLSQAS